MFKIIWFLIWAILISAGISWLASTNGLIVINWFGYEISTDGLTASLVMLFLFLLAFAAAYLLAKILSFKDKVLEKFKKPTKPEDKKLDPGSSRG